jgi:hypothetical protein
MRPNSPTGPVPEERNSQKRMRLKLISCEVLYRELCFAVSRSPHQIDLEFLPKGLHDIGCVGMRSRLQTTIDAVDTTQYDALLLGYGLCNYGITGLSSRDIPLVIPRAHDCMTLFFGDKERYMAYFQEKPGTYFLTSGWLERGEATGELKQLSIQHETGMDLSYEALVDRYGEDNARYLYDELCNQTKHYSRIAFLNMGVEPDDRFQRQAREKATTNNWSFESIQGDMRLILNLVDGKWDTEDFLLLRPGEKVAVSHDGTIIVAEEGDR